MGAVRRVPVTIVDVVDVVAMGDRLVATAGAMFVPVALGLVVARASRAGQPAAHRRPHRSDEKHPDRQQDDRSAGGGVGGIRDDDAAHRTHQTDRHRQASALRKLRPMSWAAALGTIISALMSSSPTIRIDTTTVTAVRIASARLRASTGRPADWAYSSSLATANSRHRRTATTARMTTVSTPKTHRSPGVTVVIAPNRYAVRLAGVPREDFAMITTLAAMPP